MAVQSKFTLGLTKLTFSYAGIAVLVGLTIP